jgi:pyridoxamine 5'-phosphate oxidase
MNSELWRLGEQYVGAPIDPESCDPDPFVMVRAWLAEAVAAKLPTPNAMTLATVDARNRPAARIVLLKGIDSGFTFFTNYTSRKGDDLARHGYAALVMYWEQMHRQIRIEGTVERVEAEASDAYFATRARGSQLGAIASPQSQPIANRAVLDELVAKVTADAGGLAPARPGFWGGYRVIPDMIELWQGQASRLHDRVRYLMTDGGAWVRDRLAP